ncbi:hypothetical protein [Cardiobacterium hominis]|uniref:hypothetical protein n=1 Tax=Cardiobacterium hominis TaxID=2718 RepID=UPI0028E3A185|nr:hypothetical protein [Cardiobacterium hominis]
MNYKNNAMFIAARNGRPASAMVSVLRPRVSLDVDLLNTLDAEEIRLWMLCQAMQQGRGHITPDQRQIASILNTTQSTISRRLKTLRALRYLALLPGRTKNIRERQSYIVYSQPASIETVLLVDQHYLIFLQDESRKGGSRLRQLCKDELFALPRDQYELYLALPADEPAPEEDAGTKTDEAVPQTITLPLCTLASRDEDAESPLCTAASRGEEAESPLCTPASRGEEAELPLCMPASRGEEAEFPLCTPASRGEEAKSPLCTAASRGEEAESPLCTAASRGEEAESPLCTAASRGGEAESPLCTPASRDEKREDIYNRARMHPRVHARTPTHRGIKNKVFNNNHTSLDGGCGGKVGKKFAYFAEDYIGELLDRLNAKYGKRTTHAVCNLLKQGSYEMDGTVFRHQTDEEDAAIVLMSLLDQAVKVPQRYVTKLLYRAHLGELTYVGDQHRRLNDIRQMLADTAWREQLEALHIADGSVLTDAHGNACLVVQQRLQGNAPAWHGRVVEDIKPAVLRGEWQIAPEDTRHALREQLRQSAAEEQRKNEDFWQDVQNLLHPGRASNVR